LECISHSTYSGRRKKIKGTAAANKSTMGSPDKSQVTWQVNSLPKGAKAALDFLSGQEWLRGKNWYLAGGTALAMYEGHRVSLDLDFFTSRKTFQPREVLVRLQDNDWTVDIAEPGTVYASFAGTKVSFIAYPFFVSKEQMERYGSVSILNPRDIAVMKIIAISQRGRKRDFVDLYWYVKKHEPLADVLPRLPGQYPTVAHDYHHILKSLMYFADADEDPMPKIFFKTTWPEIKKYFKREVPRLTKEFLGLRS